jgi:PqqD family protein of HPr-rel-A system
MTPPRAAFVRVPGTLIERLADDAWAAYSPACGESHLLNETSVAVLGLLDESAATPADAVCAALAADRGLPVAAVSALLAGAWTNLVQAGLVRQARPDGERG